MEVTINYFMSVFEETHAFSMWTIDFCFTDVNYVVILEKFWMVEGWVKV